MSKSDGWHVTVALKRLGMTAFLSLLLVGVALSIVSAMEPSAQPLAPMAAPDLILVWTSPANGATIAQPGERMEYTLRAQNVGDPGTGFLTMTLPSQIDMSTVLSTTGGELIGDSVRWPITESLDGAYTYYTVTAFLDAYPVAHEMLAALGAASASNGDGSDFYPTPEWYHYVVTPEDLLTIVSSVEDVGTSPYPQAVTGEAITYTIIFTIPDGTKAYSVSPRVFLRDAFVVNTTDLAGAQVITGNVNELRSHDSLAVSNGTLIKFDAIPELTGTHALTYTVVATRTSEYFVMGASVRDNLDPLQTRSILRWCESLGCIIDTTETRPQTDFVTFHDQNVLAVAPNVDPAIDYQYMDAEGIGEGGGAVKLFVVNNNTGQATAYEGILTATTYLDYVGATPTPDGVTPLGDSWVLTWTLPAIMPDAQWPITIDVTLPSVFVVGAEIPALDVAIYQEPFAEDVPYEASYLTEDSLTLGVFPDILGLGQSKYASYPAGTDLKIGGTVAYTVIFTQAANTVLPEPYYEDVLPLGSHFEGTIEVLGAVLSGTTMITVGDQAFGSYPEKFLWYMESLTATDSLRIVTSHYTVVNDGLDYYGDKVYASLAGYVANPQPFDNRATLYWHPPMGISNDHLEATSFDLDVVQGYFPENNSLRTTRVDTYGYGRDVGQPIQFELTFQNFGHADAHELVVCDQLPLGLVLDTTSFGGIQYEMSTGGNFTPLVVPAAGDNLLCWTIDTVVGRPTIPSYTIRYFAKVTDDALVGVPLVNNVYIQDFSSLPGVQDNERYYADIDAAIPDTKHCTLDAAGCLMVFGLAVDKQPWQSNVGPTDFVTYTLTYMDASANFDYNNLVITDVFDTDIVSYVSSDPAPSSTSAGQLSWDIGTVSGSASGEITLTMQVVDILPDNVFEVVNTLLWEGDEVPLHVISRTVPIQSANLNITMTAPSNTHADEVISYTVTYSNTGSTDTSVVTLTLDYGEYVDFVSIADSGTATPVPGTDNQFTDIIANDGNHSITINLHVQSPLPYDEAGPLLASVVIASPGAQSKSADVAMILDRPVFNLQKVGPAVAPPPPPASNNGMQYDIHITNIGTYTATGVVITDVWGLAQATDPANASFYGWLLSSDGTYMTQTVLSLGIDEYKYLRFDVTVEDDATQYTNTVKLGTDQTTTQEETAFVWSASIDTSKSVSEIPAFPGRLITYTVYYTNTDLSSGSMRDALITDTLPAGFVYVDALSPTGASGATGCPAGWTFTAPTPTDGGGQAIWSCSALDNSASGSFQIWGVVSATEGSELSNIVVASAEGIPVRAMHEPLVTRVARPWLRVDKAVDPTHPVAPGDYLTYTLTYENEGTDSAHDVVIIDSLPAQLDYVSCSGGDGCTHLNGVVTWNVTEVPTGTVATVEIVAQAAMGTAGQNAVNSNYTIASDRLNTDETITGDAVTTMILAPNLDAVKMAYPPSIDSAGDHITYTIVYTNDGGGLLPNVVITDAIDSATQVDESTLPVGCATSGTPALDQVVTCNIGDLSQGDNGQVQFEVYATGGVGQGQTIRNTAYRFTDYTESEPTNETVVSVGCLAPHTLNFTVSSDPAVGEVVTFTGSALGDAPLSFSWTFDDGGTATGEVVTHTYALSDTYSVVMTVANGCGDPTTLSKDVWVVGEPDIDVDKTSSTRSAALDSTTIVTDMFTVSNVGTWQLKGSIEVSPSTTSWLNFSVESSSATVYLSDLTIASGAQSEVTLFYDPSGLIAGQYDAEIIIVSNDPDEGTVTIPVTFNITTGDDDYEIYLPLVMRNTSS